MQELSHQPQEKYYPENALDPLKTSGHTLSRLGELLKEVLPHIESELSAHGLRERNGQDLCEFATHALDHRLKESGFEAKILEGDVVVAPHDTLVHRVNLVTTSTQWVVIDLTAGQIKKLKGRRVFVKTVEPNEVDLRRMLREEYNWWFPERAPSSRDTGNF